MWSCRSDPYNPSGAAVPMRTSAAGAIGATSVRVDSSTVVRCHESSNVTTVLHCDKLLSM